MEAPDPALSRDTLKSLLSLSCLLQTLQKPPSLGPRHLLRHTIARLNVEGTGTRERRPLEFIWAQNPVSLNQHPLFCFPRSLIRPLACCARLSQLSCSSTLVYMFSLTVLSHCVCVAFPHRENPESRGRAALAARSAVLDLRV